MIRNWKFPILWRLMYDPMNFSKKMKNILLLYNQHIQSFWISYICFFYQKSISENLLNKFDLNIEYINTISLYFYKNGTNTEIKKSFDPKVYIWKNLLIKSNRNNFKITTTHHAWSFHLFESFIESARRIEEQRDKSLEQTKDQQYFHSFLAR